LARKSKTLSGYAFFVAKEREYGKKHPRDVALRLAVEYCINKGILEDYLRKNAQEVISMSFLQYNEKEARKELRREAREEGKKEGLKEGEKKVLDLMAQGLTYEEIKKKIEKMPQKNRK